jgi:hypothetical protein
MGSDGCRRESTAFYPFLAISGGPLPPLLFDRTCPRHPYPSRLNCFPFFVGIFSLFPPFFLISGDLDQILSISASLEHHPLLSLHFLLPYPFTAAQLCVERSLCLSALPTVFRAGH